MARQRGVIKFQGTIAGLSFVKSTTYGDHVRAARGSYKKAKINAVLKTNSKKALTITKVGSPVLRQLKTLETGFHSGHLWSRMLGHMHKAKSTSIEDLLESLKGIEVNEDYALQKIFAAVPGFAFSKKRNKLFVEMEISSPAYFSKDVGAREYLCEASVLFLNREGDCTMDSTETEWISFDEKAGVYEMDFAIPKEAIYFLVVCGVKGGSGGKEIQSFAAKGFRVCEWGKV